MMVESGLEFFYFEIHPALSELLLPSAKKNLPRKAKLALWNEKHGDTESFTRFFKLVVVVLPFLLV